MRAGAIERNDGPKVKSGHIGKIALQTSLSGGKKRIGVENDHQESLPTSHSYARSCSCKKRGEKKPSLRVRGGPTPAHKPYQQRKLPRGGDELSSMREQGPLRNAETQRGGQTNNKWWVFKASRRISFRISRNSRYKGLIR